MPKLPMMKSSLERTAMNSVFWVNVLPSTEATTEALRKMEAG